MDQIEATIFGAIIGGLCSIVGAWHGAKFAINFQSRRNAEQTFSDSVHEILVGMYPEPINWPSDSWQVLRDKMPEMQCAIQKITFHLKPDEITRLNTAWNDYKKYCNKINDDEIKAKPIFPTMKIVDHQSIFKNKVSRILAYKNT